MKEFRKRFPDKKQGGWVDEKTYLLHKVARYAEVNKYKLRTLRLPEHKFLKMLGYRGEWPMLQKGSVIGRWVKENHW